MPYSYLNFPENIENKVSASFSFHFRFSCNYVCTWHPCELFMLSVYKICSDNCAAIGLLKSKRLSRKTNPSENRVRFGEIYISLNIETIIKMLLRQFNPNDTQVYCSEPSAAGLPRGFQFSLIWDGDSSWWKTHNISIKKTQVNL